MSSPPPILNEPPRKKGCLKAALITLAVGFVLFVSFIVIAVVMSSREAESLEKASAPFFAKIQANEIQAAYALASPSYRESKKLSDLEAFVRETDLAGFTNAEWGYAAGESLDESALKGSITTKAGVIVPLSVTLVEHGDSFAVSGLSKKKEKPVKEKKSESSASVNTWAKKESKGLSKSWSWSTAKLENPRFVTPSIPGTDPPTFPADIPIINLEADLRNAPANTTVTAVFVLLESADGQIRNQEVSKPEFVGGSGIARFYLERNEPVIAAGKWSIQLFLNGKPAAEKIAFNIEFNLDDITRKAAAGDADAQLAVALAHRHMIIGYTGPINEAESAKWMEKSAGQGDRKAQYYLGYSYLNGSGVTADSERGFSWMKKSAGQGFPEAQIVMGTIYQNGELVERDLDVAASWFAKAADLGDLAGITKLGELYLNFGEPEPKEKGAELVLKAANAGFPEAQFVMGQMHERGIVVAADREKARDWFQQAAANGIPDAVEALKRFDGEK